MVDAALERFGRIDTLANNAGMFLAKPFTAYTDDDFTAMVGAEPRGVLRHHRAGGRADA